MKAQVETISPVKTKLTVEIPPEEVASEEQAAYQELRRTANLPGFRKGKAPLAALKRAHGGRVRADVISRLIQKTYIAALRENAVFPVNDADIQLQSAGDDAAIAYTAVVEVRPKVEANAFRGLKLKKPRVEVEEGAVDGRLEQLRSQRASFDPAGDDYAAADGDMVVIDYEGFVDGEAFDGGKGEDRSLMLGSGTFIPGFEEGLLGAKAGEDHTIEVAFPEDYRAEKLAGKEATFKVRVKEIKTRTLPDLDDEFAKEAGQTEGLEALRGQVRDDLRKEQENETERVFRQSTIDALLAAHPFEVPDSMVADQQTHSTERLRNDLMSRGMDPAMLGLDKPEFQAMQRRGAERAVRWAFLMQAIADAEQIEATDADVDERIETIAREDGRSVSVIRGFFEQGNQLDALRNSMLERKVLERVTELGTVEEVDAGGAQEGDAA
ncbi:MAG: trigger factor [Deferrisomatales bacterium]|nr:trigger factor [Deferrisomatales bacterium]